MKFLLVALAVFATVAADVSHLDGYNYQEPAAVEEVAPAAAIQESAQYLPPHEEHAAQAEEIVAAVAEPEPTQEYLPPQPAVEEAHAAPAQVEAEPEPAHILADDGYHYRAVKRIRYRYRN